MNNFFITCLIIILLGVRSFPSSGDIQSSVSEKIDQAESEFQTRWEDFSRNHQEFPVWKIDWTEEELQKRFDDMQKERWSVYFENPEDFEKKDILGRWKKEYQMPDDFSSWFSRYPFPIAPVYTLASSDYNASMISLHGLHFLAMEAPCEKNLDRFFNILDQFRVTDLVRLTPKIYKNREGTFPYWEGLMNIHSRDGLSSIEIASREIHYFPLDCWNDHQGMEPKKLLSLIKVVQNSNTVDPKMIAIHCRAGVGRTGTFIVAYVLVHEIDKQIAYGVKKEDLKISIDKIIWELSLQRPFAVTHLPQYETLYQFVNYYINLL